MCLHSHAHFSLVRPPLSCARSIYTPLTLPLFTPSFISLSYYLILTHLSFLSLPISRFSHSPTRSLLLHSSVSSHYVVLGTSHTHTLSSFHLRHTPSVSCLIYTKLSLWCLTPPLPSRCHYLTLHCYLKHSSTAARRGQGG